MTMKTIAIIATVDTKEQETRYLKELIADNGYAPAVIDVSTRLPHGLAAEYPREEVSRLGGVVFSELKEKRRDEMMKTMGLGAAVILGNLHGQGALAGAIGIGGNQGTAIAAVAMRSLPVGVPKVIVSTVASGNVRPYVEYKDIMMLFSVSDLLGGPNTVSSSILANAAGAVMGMAAWGKPMMPSSSKVIATTAFGNTNAAVTLAREKLVEKGYEVIAFHASGSCGSAMEELIEQGIVHAVLDLTTHELIGEIFGDDIYAPMKPRLVAAVERGIPLVVAPGGLDYFCFGPESSIPAKYRGRKIHHHNPYNTNVRATAEELKKTAEVMAERLNKSKGRVGVIVPLKGWSENGRKGGPLHEPETDKVFVETLANNLRSAVRLVKVDANINDVEFVDRAVSLLEDFMAEI